MLGNHQYCYPLTITDYSSYYLLACEGLASTKSGKSAFWSMIQVTLIRSKTGWNPVLIHSHRTKC